MATTAPQPTLAPSAATSSSLASSPAAVYEPATIRPLAPYGNFVSLTEVGPIGKETSINIDNSQRTIKQVLNSDGGDPVQHDLFNAVLLALLAKERNSKNPSGPQVAPGPLFLNQMPSADTYPTIDQSGLVTEAPVETVAPTDDSAKFQLPVMPQPVETGGSGTAKKYTAAVMTAFLAAIAAMALSKGDDKKAAVFSSLALASAVVA